MSTPAADPACAECGAAVTAAAARCAVCQALLPAPAFLSLRPGDDLLDAVVSIAEGGVIELAAGDFHLPHPLLVARSVTIKGAGRDATRVISEAEGTAVMVMVRGTFACYGVAFEHVGARWAHVMTVRWGTVELKGCRFKDAFRHPAADDIGDGLRLMREVDGVIERCEFLDNGSHGCCVMERARVILRDNVFAGNARSGLAFLDAGGGVAERNRAERNGAHGFYVDHDAAPELTGNHAIENARAGVAYFGAASGRAIANHCERNREGLAVADTATPTLEDNVLVRNAEWGLHLGGDSRATVRRNRAEANAWHGVAVAQEARPVLEGNAIRGNGWSGLCYADRAGGSAIANQITGNGGPGLELRDHARPHLDDNAIEGNAEAPSPQPPPPPPRRTGPLAGLFARRRSGKALLELLERAPAGGEIRLEAGVYRLDRTLVIDRPLALIGAEDGQTLIESDAPEAVLVYEGAGRLRLTALSFRHLGGAPADVVTLRSGEATIHGCRFMGGGAQPWGDRGAGLVLACRQAEVASCRFSANGGAGLRVAAGCDARVLDCVSEQNLGPGVSVEAVETLLERNALRRNQSHGLIYCHGAGGRAVANQCEHNGQAGIFVGPDATPTLKENVVRANGGAGILYDGRGAAGFAHGNTCDGNRAAGIEVGPRARPVLEHNHLLANSGAGLAFRKRAAGKATGNRYRGNHGAGLLLEPGAQPVLKDNGAI